MIQFALPLRKYLLLGEMYEAEMLWQSVTRQTPPLDNFFIMLQSSTFYLLQHQNMVSKGCIFMLTFLLLEGICRSVYPCLDNHTPWSSFSSPVSSLVITINDSSSSILGPVVHLDSSVTLLSLSGRRSEKPLYQYKFYCCL